MGYAGRNNIYEATIKRMVIQAVEAQEQEFACEHGNDSEAQLLTYLQLCAQRLGHTPWPKEIVGGSLIESRFGSWEDALTKAKLPKPVTPDKTTCFARFLEETEKQKLFYREKKSIKKKNAQHRHRRKKEKQSV